MRSGSCFALVKHICGHPLHLVRSRGTAGHVLFIKNMLFLNISLKKLSFTHSNPERTVAGAWIGVSHKLEVP